MSGTQKLKPLFIGKSANQGYFKFFLCKHKSFHKPADFAKVVADP